MIGTILQTDRFVAPGDIPPYHGGVPVNGSLTHCGWSDSTDIYGNTIMTAMFIDGPNENIGGDEHSIASWIIAIYRSLNRQGLVIS